MPDLHKRAGRLHLLCRLRGPHLSLLPESVAGSRLRLPSLQDRVRGDEGITASQKRPQHVRIFVSLRLRRDLHLREQKAPLQRLQPMHRAAKVSLLLNKYQSDVARAGPSRAERLRGTRAPLQRLQPERLSNVLRLRITASKLGPRVRKRHASPGWTVQAPSLT